MKYQAKIKVGRFGRIVYTTPCRWKWSAILDAEIYCLCEMRETSVSIIKIEENKKSLSGAYLEHPDGFLQEI